MSKRCELQKEYYQQYGNYKGNGKYCDKYVIWLENEILALRQPPVIGSVCEHPYASLVGEEHGNAKCLKCGKNLNEQTDL